MCDGFAVTRRTSCGTPPRRSAYLFGEDDRPCLAAGVGDEALLFVQALQGVPVEALPGPEGAAIRDEGVEARQHRHGPIDGPGTALCLVARSRRARTCCFVVAEDPAQPL